MLQIYSASAGSGKTNRLVNEYLKFLLLKPSSYKNILAITFTNNAASEMKNRVLESLKEISEGNFQKERYSILIDYLKSKKIDLEKNAQASLDFILHDYDNFSITTIDSFFHKIIKSFAKELNLPIGFEVEIDTDLVLEEVKNKMLDDLKDDPVLFEYTEKYVLSLIEDEKGWNIDRKLSQLGKELFKEDYLKLTLEKDEDASQIEKLKNFLIEKIEAFETEMKSLSMKAEEMLSKYNLSITDFYYSGTGVGNYLVNNLRKKKYSPNAYVYKAYNENIWYKNNSEKASEIDRCVNEGLGKILRNVISLYGKEYKTYLSFSAILKDLHLAGFLRHLSERIIEYRNRHNIFLISDTNIFLRKVIGSEDAPFIFEKSGSIYKKFLVDEFQDTSILQWENIVPLLSNAFSEGNDGFIVGDAKQSIYRWRGGDFRLLTGRAEKDFSSFGSKKFSLGTNFRSRKKIIEFNNHFFEVLTETVPESYNEISHELVRSVFKDVKQETNRKEGGYVRLEFIESGNSKAENNEKAVEECLKIISELREKNYAFKDILILIRNNHDSYYLSERLKEEGVKIISQESLLIKNSFLVQFLIGIFSYLAHEENELIKRQILYLYLKYFHDEKNSLKEVFAIKEKYNKDLFSEAMPKEFILKVKFLKKLSLYEITEELIRIFHFNKPDQYVQRFQDMILEFSKRYGNDIKKFLEWWERYSENISLINTPDENAVTLMTIHASKGLQKPVVIIPFANWELERNDENIWMKTEHEDLKIFSPFYLKYVNDLGKTVFRDEFVIEKGLRYIDNLNLIYVAFTRAEDNLFILSPETKANSENIYKILKAVFEKLNTDERSENGLCISHGTLNNKESLNAIEKNSEPLLLEEYISTDWHNKLIARSRKQGRENLYSSSLEEKMNHGIILHEILSRINYKSDIGKIVDEIIYEGIVDEGKKEKYLSEINEILSLKEFEEWMNKDFISKTETEIIDSSGAVLRPDRIVIKKNEAVVIDYKSGAEKEEDKNQIKLYCEKMCELGFENVKGYLVYLLQKKIVKVI